MLETFDWTGGVVLRAPHVTVTAGLDPNWDMLAGFKDGAVFGFVLDGENAIISHGGYPHAIGPGCYFVANAGRAELRTPGGRVLLIHQPGADFPFVVGGPIEPRGRLKYIDGCTDSLLIPPWRKGEGCLNHLHIPPGIEQTMHTHPSDRIGVVVSGSGQCVSPDGTTDLRPGMIWRIPAYGLHRFRTDAETLQIVAWHPDSDTGPTDDDHPMLRKTFVGDVSAMNIPEIRTR